MKKLIFILFFLVAGYSTSYTQNDKQIKFCETLNKIIDNVANQKKEIMGEFQENDMGTDYYDSNVRLSWSAEDPYITSEPDSKLIETYIEILSTGITEAGLQSFYQSYFDDIHACLGDNFKRTEGNALGPTAYYSARHVGLLLHNIYDKNGHYQITIDIGYEK